MTNVRKAIPRTGDSPQGRETLRAALGHYRPGRALPQIFYKDPAIFELDMRHFVTAHWHCVGHASMVPNAGDFFTVDIGRESIIIVRGADRQIRALVNVCSHRGSRVCVEAQGTARNGAFQCPYHAWTYDCSGALLRARQSASDFRSEDFGLQHLPLRECEGVLFLTFTQEPPGFRHAEESFGAAARIYGWARARVAARRSYLINANWKLVVENYNECYHCGPAHQEYARRHAFSRPPEQRVIPDEAMARRDAEMGIGLKDLFYFDENCEPGQESAACFRSGMVEGFQTGSRDGRAVAPLMGDFQGKDYDSGVSFLDLGPTSNFIAYPDYGVIYRTIPLTVDKTAFELLWLVDENALAGKDYDEQELLWMWDYTSHEDKKIIELNQAGVNSAFYEPGPFSPMEDETERFVRWYVESMQRI